MSRRRRDAKGPPDQLENIPSRLLLIRLEDAETKVSSIPFPKRHYRIRVSYNQEVEGMLKASPYVTLGHIVRHENGDKPEEDQNPIIYSIGVLGRVERIKRQGPLLMLYIHAFTRVRLKNAGTQNNITMTEYEIMNEENPSEEELHSPQFQDRLAQLEDLTALKELLKRHMLPESYNFMKAPAGKLGECLDNFANFFNDIAWHTKVVLLLPATLAAANVSQRLDYLIALARFLSENPELMDGQPDPGLSQEADNTSQASDTLIQNLLSAPRELPRVAPSIATEVPQSDWARLDPELRSEYFRKGMEFFGQRMVNQLRPIEQLLLAVTSIRIGMKDPNRPEVAGIFSGPTGVGKTESVKILAEFLFNDPSGYIHIEGNTLILPHSVARLTGAEPGYIGYDEEPRITQWKLDKAHVMWAVRNAYRGRDSELRKITAEIAELEAQLSMARQGAVRIDRKPIRQRLMKLTGWKPGAHLGLILIDEIEKAHENVQRTLIRVLDDGILQLANGEIVNCRNAIFIFTSNIYGREIAARISGKYIFGIRPAFEDSSGDHEKLSDTIYRETVNALEKFVLPEFLGRIGKENVRVFHPFSPEDISAIIEKIELPMFAERLRGRGIEFFITDAALLFIKEEAMDPTNRSLGARAIKSVIQRKLREAISALIDVGEEGGIASGDHVLVDVEDKDDGDGKRIIIKKLVRSSS